MPDVRYYVMVTGPVVRLQGLGSFVYLTMKFFSEGALVLASAKALADEYKNKEFDYDFPEGLSQLLEQNAIIALTTSAGDSLVLEIQEEKLTGDYDKVITQWIELQPADDILILSHAEFTGI